MGTVIAVKKKKRENHGDRIMKYHKECRENGQAMNGVMTTLTSVVLTVHLIMNISNANNNNNNNNNNDNYDNNNNNVFVGQSVSQNEFDNDYGTMSINPGRSFQDFDFDEFGENESQSGNKTTIHTTITSLLWKSALKHLLRCQKKIPIFNHYITMFSSIKKK